VVGRVEIRTWEDDKGKRNYATNIIVEEAYFAGNKSDSTDNRTPLEQEGFKQADNKDDDELPF
jgi:single-strand DNA-binding protein